MEWSEYDKKFDGWKVDKVSYHVAKKFIPELKNERFPSSSGLYLNYIPIRFSGPRDGKFSYQCL